MKETITTKWLSDLAFEAEVDGHKIYMDSSMEHGGKNTGPRPKPLMMIALAGCTGMDVAAILKKMKVNFEEFSVEVEGDITEDHPKRFEEMKVIYRLKGKDINRKNVEKAVNLSATRYCGVSANYEKAFPITHEIIIEEE
ncbi:MAG: OsmC family peroxiredoxin [Bacteroidetes bacterium]|nr:MAG: OsmC family peroxiredoxin [Bacteroidota bacterium]RLD72972.1 MAG: OsmC family peroxiredoxin [Bacteroidota bacterium]RLD91215.1 MAG: OsmC family peroxiredoxin [Bacteroidota bacterium]